MLRTAILITIALLAALAAAGFRAAPPQAITVIEQGAESVFPDGMRVWLEAESDSEIREVQVYCRVRGSRPGVSFVRPDFQPGKRIRAEYTMSFSLPPGVSVECSFNVTDAQGHTLDTPLERYVYTDTRFQWQTAPVRGLTLYYHDAPKERVDGVVKATGRAMDRMRTLLGQTPNEIAQYVGTIYNSQTEAAAAFPAIDETLAKEHIFAGFAFETWGAFVGVGMTERVVVHETAHLYMSLAAPGGVPSWVGEGFASYMEDPGKTHRDWLAALSGQPLMPLRDMNALPGTEDAIRVFYLEAPAAVSHLIETYGDAKFAEFVRTASGGGDAEVALRLVHGFGVEELDGLWRRGIPPADSNGTRLDAVLWLQVAPAVLFLGTALVAGVLLVLRARRTRWPEDTDAENDEGSPDTL